MSKLTRAEFDVLATLDEPNGCVHCSWEDATDEVKASLTNKCLVDGAGAITPAGLEALEPYRARRAVLLASGFGSRMLPITINTPKPLVRVKGRRIIDSLLDALVAVGVEEIYIVRGYLKEQFDTLLYKYPTLQFIDNPIYDSTNNISSAMLAEDHFQNCYAFESDLYLVNTDLISRYQWHSNYLGVPVESTPDWCFVTDSDGVIVDLKKGGENCHHMYGISYWSAEDGAKLAVDLRREFEASDETKQRFWDDVPCVLCQERYGVHVRECTFDDIQEIDSFAELQALDDAYVI